MPSPGKLRVSSLPTLAILVVVAAAVMAGAPAPALGATVRSPEHIQICHALGNGGFNHIYPAVDNVVHASGHSGHPRDIIPPFDYVLSDGASGHFPGLNWDAEGQAIWSNGCVRLPPPSGHIEVFPSCVDVHGDTYDATFGYQSNNTADVTVGIGGANGFSPAPADRGQVTVFHPGKVLAAFTVTGITDAELTWSVTFGGHTSTAMVTAAFGLPCTEPPSPEADVPIGVFVTCVVNHGSTYDAMFGYESDNADPEDIPVGDANGFAPAPQDRGQPVVFMPGRHEDAVTVRDIPSSVDLTWTLAFTDTRSATATADFEPKCSVPSPPPAPPPAPPPPLTPPPVSPRPVGVFASCVTNHGSTYDATFGYVNENLFAVTIPIGQGNAVRPGPPGRGQPEKFVPGFVAAAFTVRHINAAQRAFWKVTVGGQKRVATASADLPAKCLVAPITPVADARVIKTVSPPITTVGRGVTVTITVRNVGSAVLRHVEVSDTLSGRGLEVRSVTSSHGTCATTRASGTQRVRCRGATLAPAASMTIRISTRAVTAGTARDRAAIVSPAHLAAPKGSVATASVRVLTPPPPNGGTG